MTDWDSLAGAAGLKEPRIRPIFNRSGTLMAWELGPIRVYFGEQGEHWANIWAKNIFATIDRIPVADSRGRRRLFASPNPALKAALIELARRRRHGDEERHAQNC
ncbi:hypothetical protein GGD83_003766 [Rhodoblastus sphagnicola]|uniref:hypothetical protein n=1 Tax=Rhodoblastus sphagnicola TaxID=333368 RepID=UPI0011B08AB0|nr:hypothetical protein [Rhodoblastus sphagnicola]MBB4199942.1 hypothetical protein [Rhodoblastus sphagnicola]